MAIQQSIVPDTAEACEIFPLIHMFYKKDIASLGFATKEHVSDVIHGVGDLEGDLKPHGISSYL